MAVSTAELEEWTIAGKVNFGLLPALEIPGGIVIEQRCVPLPMRVKQCGDCSGPHAGDPEGAVGVGSSVWGPRSCVNVKEGRCHDCQGRTAESHVPIGMPQLPNHYALVHSLNRLKQHALNSPPFISIVLPSTVCSCAIMEYIAEVADKEGRGQGGNKYCGLPKETAVVRGYCNAVG